MTIIVEKRIIIERLGIDDEILHALAFLDLQYVN